MKEARSPFVLRLPFCRSNRLLTAFFVLVITMELPPTVAGSKASAATAAFGVIFGLICTVLAVRSWRCATLRTNSVSVSVNALLRTRRWSWADIQGFDVVLCPVGAMAYRRAIMRVRLSGGRTVRLTELNVSPRSVSWQTTLSAAAAHLSYLAQRS